MIWFAARGRGHGGVRLRQEEHERRREHEKVDGAGGTVVAQIAGRLRQEVFERAREPGALIALSRQEEHEPTWFAGVRQEEHAVEVVCRRGRGQEHEHEEEHENKLHKFQ